MEQFTMLVQCISILFIVGSFLWLIMCIKSLFAGFICTCSAITVCYLICRFSYYIAEGIIWGIRFSAVIAILAFIVGIFPRKKYDIE